MKKKPSRSDGPKEKNRSVAGANLVSYFKSEMRRAQKLLSSLVGQGDAWSLVHVTFSDVVSFGWGAEAESVLGPMTPSADETLLPTREIPAVLAIVEAVRGCEDCGKKLPASGLLNEHVAIGLAERHHQALFRQYCKELEEVEPLYEDSLKWRSAQRGAVANAVLGAVKKGEGPDSNIVGAGADFLKLQQMIDDVHVKHERSVEAERARVTQAERERQAQEARQRRSKGGKIRAASRRDHMDEHCKLAQTMWAEKPDRNIMEVARLIERKPEHKSCKLGTIADHIRTLWPGRGKKLRPS